MDVQKVHLVIWIMVPYILIVVVSVVQAFTNTNSFSLITADVNIFLILFCNFKAVIFKLICTRPNCFRFMPRRVL